LRGRRVEVVAKANAGRATRVMGVSSGDAAESLSLARKAREVGAQAVMAMNPASLRDKPEAIAAYYRDVAAAGMTVILQNAPPPLGSALSMAAVAKLVAETPGVAYVKEETLPCGQRISQLLALKPAPLAGVFGGGRRPYT